MSETNQARNMWLLSFAGMLLFFLLMTGGILSLGCVCLEDAWEQYWPWFLYLAENVSQGRFPLWDPHSSCGFPFHANPQAGTFYPIYLLFGWIFGGGYRVFVGLWLGHWFFAMAGCFLLAKRLGLSPLAAFAASVTFGFGGFFVGNAEHTSFINAAAYVPWVLLAADTACEKGLWYACVAGAVLGMAGLSGYPGIVFFMALMMVLWCVLRYRLTRRTIATLAVTLAVGFMVMSPGYVAFLIEGSGYTHRAGPLDVKAACHSERFPFGAMISLLVPRFTIDFREFVDCDLSMSNGYFGLLGLLSVVVTVFHDGLRQRWKWLLLWMLAAWLLSLGSEGGLRVIAYYVIPVLKYVRHASLFREFWILGGALLTGAFLDALLNATAEESPRLTALALHALAVALYVCLSVFLWILIVPDQGSTWAALVCVGAPAGVVVALILAFLGYRQAILTSTMCAALLTGIVLVDLAVHLSGNMTTVCAEGDGALVAANLENLRRQKAQVPLSGCEKRYDAPRHHPNEGLFDGQMYLRSYNPALSPDYDFLVGGSVGGAAPTTPERTPFLGVLENAPRFWLTPEVSYSDVRDRRALRAVRGTGFTQAVPIFVHSRVPGATDWPQAPIRPGTYGAVHVIRYLPESVILQVEAPGDAWLFCAERYAPGWKALVDGKQTRVHKADFCFRAVHIPQGVHEVRLQYAPWLHKPFWVLSWFTILVVFGALAIVRVRDMRRHKP